MGNSLIPALTLSNSFSYDVRTLSDKYMESYFRYLDSMWQNITSEITYLVYIGTFTWCDVQRMTPYERRFHLSKIMEAKEKDREAMEKARRK